MSKWPEGEDARWQVELAIAQVLAGLGRPQPAVVERYRDDSRAWVRRYARRVAVVQPGPGDLRAGRLRDRLTAMRAGTPAPVS